MPGHCAMMSSIHIWKMSWLILSPNGTQRKWYLPRCVLNVVSKDAFSVRCIRKMPCFHLPLRIWLLRWVRVLFPRESVLYGALVWLLCWDPSDLDKSSTCRWVSLDTLMSLPMVLVLSVLLWCLGGPFRSAPFRSLLCARWALSIFRVVRAVCWGRFWCHILLTCHLFDWKSWETGSASPWYY